MYEEPLLATGFPGLNKASLGGASGILLVVVIVKSIARRDFLATKILINFSGFFPEANVRTLSEMLRSPASLAKKACDCSCGSRLLFFLLPDFCKVRRKPEGLNWQVADQT